MPGNDFPLMENEYMGEIKFNFDISTDVGAQVGVSGHCVGAAVRKCCPIHNLLVLHRLSVLVPESDLLLMEIFICW